MPLTQIKLKNQSGFSLVELIAVIAVIAILAAIAVPSYSRYITKEKVRTAQSDLQQLALRIEHRYQRVLSYPASAYTDTAALKAVPELETKWLPASDLTEFSFSTSNASTTTYTLNATGLKGKFKDCVVSMTHDGSKTISACTALVADGKWI